VNLLGVVHGCRLFGAQMVERGEGGHLVNLASLAAFLPQRNLPAYSTTKAAVLMLSECLRAELGEHGIGVSAICPGIVKTGITSSTRYVGLSEEEQTAKARKITKGYARRNYGPEKVALAIVKAVEKDTPVMPVTPEAHVGAALSRLSPAAARAFARVDLP
jgi:short-subunit dehydrogenase